MNETSSSPPPVPCRPATTALGEPPTVSPVPPAALDLPTRVLGTDWARSDADFGGHRLRVHEFSLGEISAGISRSSGTVDHGATFACLAVA
jgi:hypothetical protein